MAVAAYLDKYFECKCVRVYTEGLKLLEVHFRCGVFAAGTPAMFNRAQRHRNGV